MKVAVHNINGQETGRTVELNDQVFAFESEGTKNPAHTLYLDIKQYLGNQRQGTHKSKERSEVSGSTRKLGRQKGGGGARHGDIKLNRKMKQLARRLALTSKAGKNQIIVVEDFKFEAPRTKQYVNMAKAFNLAEKKVLLVTPDSDNNIFLSVRNVPNALMMPAMNLNAYAVLNNDAIIITEGCVNIINQF